jgi:hypothetical protein
MVQAMNCEVGNPARKLVLLKLADNANDDGVCFPSYQYIADKCEMSKRSAISHIDDLIKMGFVTKKARKNKDGLSTNLYLLHLVNGSENSALGGEKISLGSENSALGGSENSAPITSHSFNLSINRISDDEISANAEHTEVGGADKPHTGKKQNSIKVNYSAVAETYNTLVKELNSNLPLIANPSQLSDKRKKAIKKLAQVFIKRFEIETDVESALGEYFKDFLKSATNFYFGENNRGWKADFEYILRETTLDKVLEGNW